ncbi:MAG: hypothetical protein ACREJ9_11530 [Candidatus Rokuibacteriota bacterium]
MNYHANPWPSRVASCGGPEIAKLSRLFYERLGADDANELVD